MHLYPILIVAIVLAADGLAIEGVAGHWPDGTITAIALGVPAALVAVQLAMVALATRRGKPPQALQRMYRAGQFSRLLRSGIMASHGVVILGLGWLSEIRWGTGDLILIDELLAIAPPVLALAASWWVDFPIEKRLRDAVLIRRLDRGAPVYPTPTRMGYVKMQLRLQLLPLLVPLLMISTFGELARLAAQGIADEQNRFWIGEGATMAAAAGVFIIAPVLARWLLSVRRLNDGPTRRELLEICAAHRVRVREILIWDTGGVMINAAVMGIIAPLRYVLMTDALLDAMNRQELGAVMAHEIGHVRRHHLPWLVGSMMACMTAATLLVTGPLTLAWMFMPWMDAYVRQVEIGAMVVAVGLAFIGFGWISRRFERQADTFAAQHLSLHPVGSEDVSADGLDQMIDSEPDSATTEQPAQPNETVTAHAVEALQSALQSIAELNMIDPRRRSWRHGSIVWRQKYLQSLIGRSVHELAIDRVVRRLKIASAAVLIVGIALQVLLWVIEPVSAVQ